MKLIGFRKGSRLGVGNSRYHDHSLAYCQECCSFRVSKFQRIEHLFLLMVALLVDKLEYHQDLSLIKLLWCRNFVCSINFIKLVKYQFEAAVLMYCIALHCASNF